ncbi:hypothetical protein L7F22_025354 [Adiantum nelumboides]|nr:hypothetical protein [Adiantum nelumboides]
MSQKQEEKGNDCETANESMPNIVPQESVGIVDESRELVVIVDKSLEELDTNLGEPRPELDSLRHMDMYGQACMWMSKIGAKVAIIARFGTPLDIISDNGLRFKKGLLIEVCEELKIQHRHSTPYYPQSNGLVEKANGIIAEIIRKMVQSKPKLWDAFLDGALWAYRTTYKDATQFTPFHLVYGQEALQSIELQNPTIKLVGREE